MAKATTLKYDQLLIEADFLDNDASWATICGMKGASVNRTKAVDTDEVPDCDDESAAWTLEKDIRSMETTIEGRGIWARQSHKDMHDWFYASGGRKLVKVRVRNADVETNGAVGDPYIEEGYAYLTQLSNEKEKGKNVTADIRIEFQSGVTVENKA